MLQKVGFYLSFLINGVTKNNINSTVIDELTEYVLDAKINYYAFIGIEHYRKILLKNQQFPKKILFKGSIIPYNTLKTQLTPKNTIKIQ